MNSIELHKNLIKTEDYCHLIICSNSYTMSVMPFYHAHNTIALAVVCSTHSSCVSCLGGRTALVGFLELFMLL